MIVLHRIVSDHRINFGVYVFGMRVNDGRKLL